MPLLSLGLIVVASLALAARGESPPAVAVVRVQAVRCADDNGGRAAAISPEELRRWLDFADGVYAPAGIRFECDPARGEWTELKDTIINSTMPAPIEQGLDAARRARAKALEFPDHLVAFFRYGEASGPTGNGFSSSASPCVFLPGFNSTSVCAHQNIGLLAHEFGHYFGLDHPALQYPTVAAAEAAFIANGKDPSKFDCDGLADTPPGPVIDELGCTADMSVKLAGVEVRIARGNIMCYSYPPAGEFSITAQQAARVRWMLGYRAKHGMPGASNADAAPGDPPVECESMTVLGKSKCSASEQEMTGFGWLGWSKDRQLLVNADPGASLTLEFSVPIGGRYSVDLFATLAPDFGTVRVAIDDGAFSTPIDLYAPRVLPTGAIELGRRRLGKGPHRLTISVAGKNSRSTGHKFGLDCLRLHAAE